MFGFLLAASLSALQTHTDAPTNPEVTVYNQGFGLVKELRNVRLKEGRQSVSITDVPTMIDVTSVGIRSITEPGSFDVLEQNYQYDLVNVQSILNKSVGGKIRLIRHFADKLETLEGTLVSSPTAITGNQEGGNNWTYNGMVVKTDDGHYILNPVGEVEVMSMPEGMISLPTLVWDLESRRAGENLVELSYIANGIRWEANYVLTLDSESNSSALQGWVNLNNACGATFKEAKLKLLAGDVHTAPNVRRTDLNAAFGARAGAGGGGFLEQQLFEYHLYTLQRPATIKDKEIKQLSLLSAAKVPFKKRLIIDSLRDYGVYYPSQGEIGSGNLKPQVRVEFVNDEQSGLGIPLPAGKFRIYQRDNSGSVQLLGEDSIQHTPKNEKVSLLVGNAFDIVANRKRLNFEALGGTQFREQFEIEVRNRKATSETVELLERHYGDWTIEKTSEPFTKEDANTMKYTVRLKPNEVRKVTYTVYTHW
ncbi:MAG TPA: hypothetical protein VKT78_06865 [Fimbriimonadaceae bacterium]|nr:hypothetical protein [Fimbriimonadaceae bacterium]